MMKTATMLKIAQRGQSVRKMFPSCSPVWLVANDVDRLARGPSDGCSLDHLCQAWNRCIWPAICSLHVKINSKFLPKRHPPPGSPWGPWGLPWGTPEKSYQNVK